MRTFPSPDDLLKPRDRFPALYVTAVTWGCHFCPQPGGDGAGTTVVWLGDSDPKGIDGRCAECGQKYILAHASDRHVPSIREQLEFQGALDG